MHLLDADTLTYLHAGHEKVVQRLRRCDDLETGIAIITKAEVLRARCEFLRAPCRCVAAFQQNERRCHHRLSCGDNLPIATLGGIVPLVVHVPNGEQTHRIEEDGSHG